MTIMITDTSIKGLTFAWSEIDIVAVYSYPENLGSFARNHSQDCIECLLRGSGGLQYDPSKVSQVTKWGADVYTYTARYPDSPGTKNTLYMLKQDNEIILVNVYINNSSDQYDKIINPILDSMSFNK